MNKSQDAASSNNNKNSERKEFHTENQFRQEKKSMWQVWNKFHEKKNQRAISSTKKNRHTESSMNNKSIRNKLHEQNQFNEEKINVQVPRTEKSTSNKFHEQKSAYSNFRVQNKPPTTSMSKNSLTERKTNVKDSWR